MNAIITIITTTVPSKFFGVPTRSITTETDAISAIKYFCEAAPAEVIDATAEELKVMSEINHDFYEVVNDLLWKVELPLGSYAWNNRFKLLNAELK